jgi:hypothetical protein
MKLLLEKETNNIDTGTMSGTVRSSGNLTALNFEMKNVKHWGALLFCLTILQGAKTNAHLSCAAYLMSMFRRAMKSQCSEFSTRGKNKVTINKRRLRSTQYKFPILRFLSQQTRLKILMIYKQHNYLPSATPQG